MGREWYYQIMGEVVGPISSAQLRSLADAGTITKDTLIRTGESGDWVSADRLKGLFQSAPELPPIRSTPKPPEILPVEPSLHGLPVIRRDQLPPETRDKPRHDELIHHFAYIDSKGGCASQSVAKQWILITDARILFEASVIEGVGDGAKFVHQSGSIPIQKVSYIGIVTKSEHVGCANVPVTALRVSSGGGEVVLSIPTIKEAERARDVIDEVLAKKR